MMSDALTVTAAGMEQHASPGGEAAPQDHLPHPSVSHESADTDAFHAAVSGLQEALVSEMSGIVGRMITSTLTETDTVVKRARAEAQRAVDEAADKLAARTRENETLTQSLQDAQNEMAKLRLDLEVERKRANAAWEECETLRKAHSRAEEAEANRQAVVAAYEAQLRALRAELDAQAAERTKLIAVLQTVQQTVSASGPDRTVTGSHRVPANITTTDQTDRTPEHDKAAPHTGTQPRAADTAGDTAETRSLKLVPSEQQTPIDAPPQVLEHVKQLLDEIETMYWADVESADRPADVVERLTVNLRYAWDLFTRRMPTDGGASATVFEQQLSALLDAKAATSFGRHLSIAAHQIVARSETLAANDRAAAAS
jgi:hypothetical protein